MNPPLLESITKAAQSADLLARDVREAHRNSCGDNPALEILLRDLIADAMKVKNRLAEIEASFK